MFSACKSAPLANPYPHESVLLVVAELKLFLRFDPYRNEPGRDLEGRNIFRVSLERLDALRTLVGPEYRDVLAFARAECLERLGRYAPAADAFAEAARSGQSLGPEAARREAWTRALAEVTTEPDISTLQDYLNYWDARIAGLEQLRTRNPVVPYDSLIEVEIERAMSSKAVLVFDNRFVLPRGAEQAIEAAQRLAGDHAESYLVGEHDLLLGHLFGTLAFDYAQMNDPSSAAFDIEIWKPWVDQARAAYSAVAGRDGDPAKPEGQARLRALDAFELRVLRRAR